MTVQDKYLAWLDCPAMTEELLDGLRSMDQEELDDSFCRNLAFGTGGLRGILGAGTNRMNLFTVMKATRGLGSFLLRSCSAPSCAVSYDSRIHSRDFAELTAAVLAEMGIRVQIYPLLRPTPMLSFAVRHLSASAGVMITASHNPAKYNGYKVYGPDGCQITPEAATLIQREIENQADLAGCLPSFEHGLSSGMISYIPEETVEAYYRSILNLRVAPSSHPLHVVYSPLNGTGNLPVREILRRMGNIRVDIVTEQELPDGSFPTCPYPNPEITEAMSLAISRTVQAGADICFATDPDCDRIGVGVRTGREVTLISGNDLGILLLDYLCTHTAGRGPLPPVVVKTIVTTEMAAALCRKHGLELRNVLTGFKYIGEQISLLESNGQKDRFLFGFEESCGYLSGTDVRDKDAVNAALLLCDMAAGLKSRGLTLTDRLHQLQEEFGLYVQRLLTFEYEGIKGAARMQAVMDSLRGPLDTVAGPLLGAAVRTDYLSDHTGLPKSDVLSFDLFPDDRIIIRPSGTEPKLKAYLFSKAGSPAEAERNLDRLEQIISQVCG